MAEGTRFAQLFEVVAANREETAATKETFQQHTEILKNLMDQVSNLASSFASFSQN
jgi:uncharacterized membrane protein